MLSPDLQGPLLNDLADHRKAGVWIYFSFSMKNPRVDGNAKVWQFVLDQGLIMWIPVFNFLYQIIEGH